MEASSSELRPRALASRAIPIIADRCGGNYRLEAGILVAVEGIDGAGVSTTAEALAAVFSKLLGGDACYTKEPTSGPVGFLVWQALSSRYLEPLKAPPLLALLFAADRLWHLIAGDDGGPGVLGCLARPALVVTDRYKYSSMAYQSVAGVVSARRLPGAEVAWISEVNAYAPPAHYVIYVDVPVDVALSRIEEERWELHLYEKKRFLQAVKANFDRVLSSVEEDPEVGGGPQGSRPWERLLEAWGLDPSSIYRGPHPRVMRVDGTRDPLSNLVEAACWILDEAVAEGLMRRG